MGHKHLAFLFVLPFSNFLCSGQIQSNPAYRHLSIKDGLPSEIVYQAAQDKKGYVWFATENGLSRYDGTDFRNYSVENGLCNETTFGFSKDKENNLWAYGSTGELTQILDDSIFCPEFNIQLNELAPRGVIKQAVFDDQNRIWISKTNQPDLICVDRNKADPELSFIPFPEKEVKIQIREIEEGNFISHADFRKTNPSDLISLTNSKGNSTFFNRQKQINKNSTLSNCIITKKNGAVTGVIMDLLFELSEGSFTVIRPDYFPVQCLLEDSNGDVWVGSRSGIYCYKNGDLTTKPDHYFSEFSVSSVLEDMEGGYWFTTLENGILYVPEISVFSHLLPVSEKIEKLTIATLGNDSMMFGLTNTGSLYSLHLNAMETGLNHTGISNPNISFIESVGPTVLLSGYRMKSHLSFSIDPLKTLPEIHPPLRKLFYSPCVGAFALNNDESKVKIRQVDADGVISEPIFLANNTMGMSPVNAQMVSRTECYFASYDKIYHCDNPNGGSVSAPFRSTGRTLLG